ncbi:MAG: hypothetical protein HY811_09820 [Planctomycetes bacterium]|nr:hypothetical protein [Planctomycetota bacterium]
MEKRIVNLSHYFDAEKARRVLISYWEEIYTDSLKDAIIKIVETVCMADCLDIRLDRYLSALKVEYPHPRFGGNPVPGDLSEDGYFNLAYRIYEEESTHGCF